MRALILVLDGLGCGAAPDAAAYGDQNADTLGHLFSACPRLHLPTLFSLGLWKILTADVFDPRSQHTIASYGRMRPRSPGNDSLSALWEIAGVVRQEPFAQYSRPPADLVSSIERDARVQFLVSPEVAKLLDQAPAHLRLKQPILAMGPDSSLLIAAHQSLFTPKHLHQICTVARRHANTWHLQKVTACPLVGPAERVTLSQSWDLPVVPPRTMLNALADSGRRVHSIGQIAPLFAHSGFTDSHPCLSNNASLDSIASLWNHLEDGLLFANLPDLNLTNDSSSLAEALLAFDHWLANFLPLIESDDLVILCADHGHDSPGHSHTREEVPLMVLHRNQAVPLGTRKSFADIAASLIDFFLLRPRWPVGTSFLRGHRLPK